MAGDVIAWSIYQEMKDKVAFWETEARVAKTDIADTYIPRLTALEQENKRLRDNMRETYEAMVAMRNTINEHIPMPSIESDLLSGPESSVFCSRVAQSVIAALTHEDKT